MTMKLILDTQASVVVLSSIAVTELNAVITVQLIATFLGLPVGIFDSR